MIHNTARKADELDTSIPVKSSTFTGFSPINTFHRGNEDMKRVLEKARLKANIKTADERRRERLKKQIVVVGIMDQSPGW